MSLGDIIGKYCDRPGLLVESEPERKPKPKSVKVIREKLPTAREIKRRQIVQAIAENPGVSGEQLAQEFGVSRMTISRIRRDKSRAAHPPDVTLETDFQAAISKPVPISIVKKKIMADQNQKSVPIFCTRKSLAVSIGLPMQQIFRGFQSGAITPDGFTDGGQPLFRADRIEAIKSALAKPEVLA